VQCGQCVDACAQTQAGTPDGPLLNWVHDLHAESEAAFNVRAARAIPIMPVASPPAQDRS